MEEKAKTVAEIKQEMYNLGYMYYPSERVFRAYEWIDGKLTGNMITKTWKEAREFLAYTRSLK